MGKKFDAVFESVVQRYQSGGFISGDSVVFKPSYKSSDTYKAMHSQMQKDLDDLVNSGLNILVTQVGNNMGGHSAGTQFKNPVNATVTVAGDQGGGRHYGYITVSPDMLEIVDNGPNHPKIPDQFKRKDKIVIKPEEYKADSKNITRVTDKGNGKNTPTNLKLGESAIFKKDMDNLASLWEQTNNE